MAKNILQVFDTYQKARISFVEQVAHLASYSYNIPILDNAGVVCLLQQLLTDISPSVQQYAAIAVGRLANYSEQMAQNILQKLDITLMVSDLDKKSKYYKKAVMYTLRSISKHSEELAQTVVNYGGLEAMILCMEDFDYNVKISAVWAVGYIARHSKQLAQATIDAGAVPLLILCLQEPEIQLKQVTASTLTDIAKHGQELAQTIVDCSGSLVLLSRSLDNQDTKLKCQVLNALDAIATHNTDLAEACVEAEIFPTVLLHICPNEFGGGGCQSLHKAACNLVRDIVKHSFELAQLIVNQGGITALLQTLDDNSKLSAYAAIGYIAGHSEQLALVVAKSGAVSTLSECLHSTTDQYLLATCAWALGQIGKHSSEHARYLAEANVYPKLLKLYTCPSSGEDLKLKCKIALKQSLQKCLVLSALEPLLHDTPTEILKYVLGQFSKILPNDPRARRLFVTTGSLKKVQEISAEPGSTLMEYILCVNSCFPEEIVRFYSPGYPDTLLQKVEQFTPTVCVLDVGRIKDGVMENDDDQDVQNKVASNTPTDEFI